MNISRNAITGLVLAGGRGSRMGGVDKGLQPHLGQALAWHALRRLAPQVGPLMVNANRNLEAYQALGARVFPDALADYPGPLAGMLAGLQHCTTPYMATVPCDTPNFPLNLVESLADSLASADADIAIAATRQENTLQLEPVFCLVKASLQSSLLGFLEQGRRKTQLWMGQQKFVEVVFEDAAAF